MTDTSKEAVGKLVAHLRLQSNPTFTKEQAAGTLIALFEQVERLQAALAATEARAYLLAVAIMGGEDAHGYADSISADVLADLLRKERANHAAWCDAAATTARDDALEEAAKVADAALKNMEDIGLKHPEDGESRSRCLGRAREAMYIAEEIRAMKAP